MLKNIQKIVISKTFLISLILICLMFTSIGGSMEANYASDLNETSEIGMEIDLEDKLESSQEKEMVMTNTQENELLQASYSLDGGTFSDIQNVINRASSGDTIKLSGTFVSTDSSDTITVNKKLTITSPSTATLDGKNSTAIMKINSGGAQSKFTNLKFINGHADSAGGAVRVNAKYITFDGCVFEDNFAEVSAGAIYTTYKAETARGLTIKNCNFTNNGAVVASGAVGAFGHESKLINCIFDSNHVVGPGETYGGAIQIGLDTETSYGDVIDCVFINNKAISTDGFSHGGAGCVRNGSTYIGCSFINNSADRGGALTFHASGNLNNCTFINNKANEFGGGISVMLNYLDYMSLNITNSIFNGNKAPLGGAAKFDGFNIKIEDSIFNENYAEEYGGAVNIEANDVEVINSKFDSNIANIDGGALYIKGNNTYVADSVFLFNDAIPDVSKLNDGLGGAIYVNSTRAFVEDNVFKFNTARNGSAIYFDENGVEFTLKNNTLYKNQAWVYHLPIFAYNIYYGDIENIKSIIYGGNNIADYDNLAVSNAIYNAADYDKIEIDGESPVSGATMSGELYQDDREYNMRILMTVEHEDGTVVYNNTLNSNYLGEVLVNLPNLKPGKYYVTAKHFEDNYYKAINNSTVFNVIPKVDNRLVKSSNKNSINYRDYALWTLNITNNGPNDATGVVVYDVLPEGLIWISDDSDGKYDLNSGVLNIGDLKVGETFVLNIVTQINKTGDIINKANVTGIEFDTNINNNHDEKSIAVPKAADLSIDKSANESNPNYNGLVKWTIKVTNNGPDVAHNVDVLDLLPESLIFDSCDTVNYNRNTGIWHIGTLGIHDSVILNIITRVNSTGIINNNASVTLQEYDYDLSNNHDEAQINVPQAVDVSVLKSVNVTIPNYNELVKWTITVKNDGPDVAHEVKVVDMLPISLKLISCDSTKYNNVTGIWNIGTLAVNESVKLNLVCKVMATGKIVNDVNVTSYEFDYDLSNNKDQKRINVLPACDLEVEKIVNNSKPNYADSIKWTIKVTNNGPDIAHNVNITDLIPESLIFSSATGGYNKNTGTWHIDTLNPSASVEFSIICKVNTTGNITNLVCVTADEFDYNLENNEDSNTIFVNKSGDLVIVKEVNNTNVNYGDYVKWILTASNEGPDKVTSVVVEDVLPNGLILSNYTASKGFYDGGVWNICCLEKGEVQTLELICLVNVTGNITNVARISGEEYDSDLTNNVDNESIIVPKAADISVSKQVDNDAPLFGDVITWTIAVTNLGLDRASNVRISDCLVDELLFKGYASTRGSYNEGIWSLDYLNRGQTEYLNISCYVNGLGTINNAVSAMADEYDIDMSNNYDGELINSSPVADLSIEKCANVSNANYNDLIRWTISISNEGYNDATGVVVDDVLPNGLEFIKATGYGHYEDGTWYVGELEVGDYKKLEIITKVIATGDITNYAIVSGNEEDPNPLNNEAEYAVYVYPACDLSITKTVSKYVFNKGDIVSYSIKLSNNGPDDALNVIVNEEFGESLVLKSYKTTKGTFDSSSNEWSIEELAAGGEEKLLLNFEAIKEGIVKNVVSVLSDTFDIDLSNNDDFALVKIVKNPNNYSMSFIKKSSGVKAENAKYPTSNLEKNPTANLILLLIVSIFISIIFGSGDIFKKR